METLPIYRRIASDLRVRIRSCLAVQTALPFRLTTVGIADFYQISQTPVRRAVDLLVAEGWLQKLSNGRLELPTDQPETESPIAHSPDFRPTTSACPPEASRATCSGDRFGTWPVGDVRERLIDTVVRLSLQGESRFLRETQWSQQLGLGRGRLRQLFSELAGQGFLEHVPRRGWLVQPFEIQSMRQYLEIREALECLALRLARGRLDPARLRLMLLENTPCPEPQRPSSTQSRSVGPSQTFQRHDRLRGAAHSQAPQAQDPRPEDAQAEDEPTSRGLNNEIHDYLMEVSGNSYIRDFFNRHSAYYTKLFELAAIETPWRAEMAAQHRQILTALLNEKWDEAQMALSHHIRSQQPVVEALLRQVQSRLTTAG